MLDILGIVVLISDDDAAVVVIVAIPGVVCRDGDISVLNPQKHVAVVLSNSIGSYWYDGQDDYICRCWYR